MAASPIAVPSQAEVETLAREYRDLDASIEEKEKAFAKEIAPLAVRRDELKQILISASSEWSGRRFVSVSESARLSLDLSEMLPRLRYRLRMNCRK